jgi:hypothetical protein
MSVPWRFETLCQQWDLRRREPAAEGRAVKEVVALAVGREVVAPRLATVAASAARPTSGPAVFETIPRS